MNLTKTDACQAPPRRGAALKRRADRPSSMRTRRVAGRTARRSQPRDYRADGPGRGCCDTAGEVTRHGRQMHPSIEVAERSCDASVIDFEPESAPSCVTVPPRSCAVGHRGDHSTARLVPWRSMGAHQRGGANDVDFSLPCLREACDAYTGHGLAAGVSVQIRRQQVANSALGLRMGVGRCIDGKARHVRADRPALFGFKDNRIEPRHSTPASRRIRLPSRPASLLG